MDTMDGKPNNPPAGLLRGENRRRYNTVFAGDNPVPYFRRHYRKGWGSFKPTKLAGSSNL